MGILRCATHDWLKIARRSMTWQSATSRLGFAPGDRRCSHLQRRSPSPSRERLRRRWWQVFRQHSESPDHHHLHHHVRPGAMAGSLILAPLCLCMLALMLCGSVADSRAVLFRDLHEPAVPEEYGVDDGPQTFTMQDHFNYLRQRELERRRRGGSSQSGTLLATSRVLEEEEEQTNAVFVSDYCHTGANEKFGM